MQGTINNTKDSLVMLGSSQLPEVSALRALLTGVVIASATHGVITLSFTYLFISLYIVSTVLFYSVNIIIVHICHTQALASLHRPMIILYIIIHLTTKFSYCIST